MGISRRTTLALPLALVLVASACSDDSDPPVASGGSETSTEPRFDVDLPLEGGLTGGPTGNGRGPSRSGLRMAPFADCSEFLAHVQHEAAERVGPYGLDPSGIPWSVTKRIMSEPVAEASSEEADATSAPVATEAPAPPGLAGSDDTDNSGGGDESAGPNVTGTNTQEVGIDEPDIIKTDGRRILTLSENVLSYVGIDTGQPVLLGQLTIDAGWGGQMFLVGDRAVLLTNAGMWGMPVEMESGVAADIAMPSQPTATIVEVDLSDPANMRVTTTLDIEGQYLNARLIGERLLLAVSSGPQWMPWLYPQTQAGEDRAIESNRELIVNSQLSDWVPQYELDANGAVSTGDLLSCSQLNHPAEFSGFDIISVLGIDLAGGVAAGFSAAPASGVLAGGQTVYASHDRFYVATTRWVPLELFDDVDASRVVAWSEDTSTDLHSFTITGGALAYTASGTVDGSLLNQFSLDEQAGYLRAITTDGTPWAGDQSTSESALVVLAENGDRLVEVGRAGGLGKGEALYSARMIGDRGYAVTFRQVDPFYVLDLTDPAAPRVTGELKIPGFSSYLHPVAEHRVLGVGQAATDEGMVTGFKLSLFDVADPANPREISTWTLDGAQSAAGYDHHAFQMIGSTAIVPLQSFDFNGAVLFDIGEAITEIGRITHVDPATAPSSDCQQLDTAGLSDTGVLSWLKFDQGYRIQGCRPGATGGYGAWYCDVVPLAEADAWWGPGATDELTAIAGDAERIEMCYPDGGWSEQIQRSVIVDGTLYTLSLSSLWAHDLATLAPIGSVTVR